MCSSDLPHALSALKIDPAKADLIAAMAVEDPSAGGNPIKLDVAATRRIFDEAMAG